MASVSQKIRETALKSLPVAPRVACIIRDSPLAAFLAKAHTLAVAPEASSKMSRLVPNIEGAKYSPRKISIMLVARDASVSMAILHRRKVEISIVRSRSRRGQMTIMKKRSSFNLCL